MAGSHPEPLHSPSELRKEAESPLNAAIRSQVRRTRKRLLAASFELIWNPEKVAQTSPRRCNGRRRAAPCHEQQSERRPAGARLGSPGRVLAPR